MDTSGTTNAPEWVEGLKWVIMAFLLAVAIIGPKIFGPLIARWNSIISPPSTSSVASMAVVGGALADRDSITALTASINRLATVLEKRQQMEVEETEEERMRKRLRELLQEMGQIEKR